MSHTGTAGLPRPRSCLPGPDEEGKGATNPITRSFQVQRMRNLAIGAIRLAGRADITEATRWAGRAMDRPFTILGLTS
jgi:hypothetical protein